MRLVNEAVRLLACDGAWSPHASHFRPMTRTEKTLNDLATPKKGKDIYPNPLSLYERLVHS